MAFSFERDNDTICAIATAPGAGGIAVIRVSGQSALSITKKLCAFIPEQPESHRIYYGFLKSLVGEKIDEVLVSYFEQGRSFTGEETLEVSCHGGRFLSSQILKELVAAGARVAQPGEFTYRAFMNGRIDLLQAEAVLELINSENASTSQLALRQLEGGISSDLKKIKSELTTALAHLEANIDFASEDIEIASNTDLLQRLAQAKACLEDVLEQYQVGRRAREGLTVLLVGEPNVGKSSLLNALLKEERAIVTDVPGTTRDLIEGSFEVSGLAVRVIDTAGYRQTEDLVESIGIEKMKSKVDQSDFVFLLVDSSEKNAEALRLVTRSVGVERLVVLFSKCDLNPGLKNENLDWLREHLAKEDIANLYDRGQVFELSSKTGVGLDKIHALLKTQVEQMSEGRSNGLMNARHFELITKSLKYVEDSMKLLDNDESPDFIASELHSSLRSIYEILGERFDDQVMDQVFREFCLGK